MSEEQIKERKERDEKIKKTEKAVLELLVGLSYEDASSVLSVVQSRLTMNAFNQRLSEFMRELWPSARVPYT